MKRAAFVLALVACVSASLVGVARSTPDLLRVTNRTVYHLRFTIEPASGSGSRAMHTLAPGQVVTFDQTGTWVLAGSLVDGQGKIVKELDHHMILMKAGDRVANLLAVDDPIAKKLRWYVYY